MNSEPRRRQPPLSLRRRKQNRLRVVPRKLSQLMRGKKTEIYLAYVTLSSMFLILACGVLLPRCCLRAILSYMHVVVYRDNTICASITLTSRRGLFPTTLIPITFAFASLRLFNMMSLLQVITTKSVSVLSLQKFILRDNPSCQQAKKTLI